jgi:hypothetical protein
VCDGTPSTVPSFGVTVTETTAPFFRPSIVNGSLSAPVSGVLS